MTGRTMSIGLTYTIDNPRPCRLRSARPTCSQAADYSMVAAAVLTEWDEPPEQLRAVEHTVR